MAIIEFPSTDLADEDGVLAVGGDLEIESLLLAYRSGIFPWPLEENLPIVWFAPPKRAVLFLEDFHISRSLRKELERSKLHFFCDRDFSSVIEKCAAARNRKGQRGTWITKEMITAYKEFHRAGFAHSIEVYDERRLVGGLYGVAINGFFAGESMFYETPNASKLALIRLVEILKKNRVKWFDCQQLTPLFASFGAKEIPRKRFQTLLKKAISEPVSMFTAGPV